MYQREKVKEKQIRVLGEQTRSIGTVSVVPMGEWRASVTYKKLNIVRAYNASWIAKKDNIGIEPTITSGWLDNWQVVAYDGTGENVVVADGNYPLMTVGNANNAQLALAAVTDNEGNNIAAALTTNANNITTIKQSLPTKVSQSQITQSLGDSQALLISQKAISTIINDIQSKLDFLSNNHIVCVRFDNISPASILGGTWVLIKDRFLIGASGKYTLGATGGSEAHTLTINELAPHGHLLAINGDLDLPLYANVTWDGGTINGYSIQNNIHSSTSRGFFLQGSTNWFRRTS